MITAIELLKTITYSLSLKQKKEPSCQTNKHKDEEAKMNPKLDNMLKEAFAFADPNEILEGIERIKAKQQKKAAAKIFPLFFLSLSYKQSVNLIVWFTTLFFAPKSEQHLLVVENNTCKMEHLRDPILPIISYNDILSKELYIPNHYVETIVKKSYMGGYEFLTFSNDKIDINKTCEIKVCNQNMISTVPNKNQNLATKNCQLMLLSVLFIDRYFLGIATNCLKYTEAIKKPPIIFTNVLGRADEESKIDY